jgi:protein-L-isoaspartate(D-aspartate) O-methyltransferase
VEVILSHRSSGTKNDGMKTVRRKMLDLLSKNGVYSNSVLEAMYNIPRHYFVSEALRYNSYEDTSLPIGFGQTISKPSIIGMMVQALNLTKTERVLEIGTGSGYQTAILSYLARNVVTLERIHSLSDRARSVVFQLKLSNVRFIKGDDFNEADGLFDAIIVAAGAEILPVDLFKKLTPAGRLIIPIFADSTHKVIRYTKNGDNLIEELITEAVFVPLVFGSQIA